MSDEASSRPDLSLVTTLELINELKSRCTMGAMVLEPRHQEGNRDNKIVCLFSAAGAQMSLIGLLSVAHHHACIEFVHRGFMGPQSGTTEAHG